MLSWVPTRDRDPNRGAVSRAAGGALGLAAPDPDVDARIRLRGLLAVLTRIGLVLPPGLDP
ncbi:hypothetical protein ACWCPL_27895, partial [Streptomyces sp. NPDC001948]